MKVIIFSASGGIGKYAVKHALKNGHPVTAFLRNPDKFQLKDKNLIVVEGEINDKSAVAEAVKEQDAVIWCVGIPLKLQVFLYPYQEVEYANNRVGL